jgi:hypothetical protein
MTTYGFPDAEVVGRKFLTVVGDMRYRGIVKAAQPTDNSMHLSFRGQDVHEALAATGEWRPSDKETIFGAEALLVSCQYTPNGKALIIQLGGVEVGRGTLLAIFL